MPIIIITGPAKTGKSLVANALRNNAIAQGNGCLLIDEDQKGETKPLIEKLLDGAELPEDPKVKDLPWKPSPLVVVVGKGAARLDEIEAALPGFGKLVGPVYTIATDKQ